MKPSEEEESKQDEHNLEKISDTFEEERSLARLCKKEGDELVLEGEENKVKKSRGLKNIYKCEHCYKSFSHKGSLKAHSQTYTLQNKRQNKMSTECNNTFSSNISLRPHSVTHTKEKTHTCEKCGKHFSQKCALKRHVENSCNEITKTCKSCKKLFRLNETVMLREKLNKCFECHKKLKILWTSKRNHFLARTVINPTKINVI